MGSETDRWIRSRPYTVQLLMAGLIVLSIGALGGGSLFVFDPTGESMGMSVEILAGSPFADFLVPGLILFIVLGVYPLVVCYGVYTRRKWTWPAALSVGIALIVWIVVQGVIIGFGHWLQWLYLLFGVVLVLLTILSSAQRTLGALRSSSLWCADPVSGDWTDETTLEFGPTIIAVYGATSVDDDLELFIDRHGKAALAPAVMSTLTYLQGKTTRRGVADELGVPAVEAIPVTQAIERIIAVVKGHDPTLSDITFEVDVHDRAIKQGPYQRADK